MTGKYVFDNQSTLGTFVFIIQRSEHFFTRRSSVSS